MNMPVPPPPSGPVPYSRDLSLELLADMLRIRRLEEKCAELYSAGKIRGFLHLYIGEEAVQLHEALLYNLSCRAALHKD